MKRFQKQYNFNNYAGCVSIKVNRHTKFKVGLYHAEQAQMDTDAGKWVTVCEEHSTCVNHSTYFMALYHQADPAGWCEQCGELEDKQMIINFLEN